jgi:hypothetical protein
MTRNDLWEGLGLGERREGREDYLERNERFLSNIKFRVTLSLHLQLHSVP